MNKLIIIGGGGQGEVVADIARQRGYDGIGFLDDDENCRICSKYPVIGRVADAVRYRDSDFIVAIGDTDIRCKLQMRLVKQGMRVVSLIHPMAVVADTARIDIGSVIMAGGVVNPYAEIGQGVIVNTCASVDHDCVIGNYGHISVGAHLAGTVSLGKRVFIGAGTTIISNISICDNCIIGAGTTVLKNINEPGTYVGTPAKKIK